MPDLIGLTEAQARTAIGDAGLSVGQPEYVADPDVARDKVVGQDPNRDTFVDPGATVTITVSTGQADDVGARRSSARTAPRPRTTLENANLVASFQEKESDAAQGPGRRDRPRGGRAGAGGHPDHRLLLRRTREGAGRRRDDGGGGRPGRSKQAGFKAFVTTSTDTEEPKGTVIEQNPDGGTEQPEGDSVTIVVSSFEEPTETPSPTITPTETPTVLPTETPSGVPSATP